MGSFGVAMETLRGKILNVVKGFSAEATSDPSVTTYRPVVPESAEHATALILSEVEPGYHAMWEQCEQLKQDGEYWRAKADDYQATAERWAATAEKKQQDVNNGIRLLEQSERQKADLGVHLAATNQALETAREDVRGKANELRRLAQEAERETRVVAEITGVEGHHPQWRNFVKPEQGHLPEGTEFLSLAKNTLLDEVNAYVSEVELGAVKCRCEWLIHPEDVDLSPDQQRKRRGMESEFCATHSKRGLVLGLFEYLFGTEETVIPAEQTEARSRLYTEYQNRLRRRMVDHLRRKGYPENQAQSIVHDFLPMIAGDFRGAWELADYLKVQLIMQYTSPVTDIIGNTTGAPLGFLSTFDEVPPKFIPCESTLVHAEHDWFHTAFNADVHCRGVGD